MGDGEGAKQKVGSGGRGRDCIAYPRIRRKSQAGPHHGQARCNSVHEAKNILKQLQHNYGGVTLHRITRAITNDGPQYLESDGLQAMVGPKDDEVKDGITYGTTSETPARDGEESAIGQFPCEPCTQINITTVNVDGMGAHEASATTRMDTILSSVLPARPDVLLLQEVVAEMFHVVRRRLPGCTFRRGHLIDFNVTILCSTRLNTGSRISSYAFPGTNNAGICSQYDAVIGLSSTCTPNPAVAGGTEMRENHS